MRMHVLGLHGMPAALGLALCVSGAGGIGCSAPESNTSLKPEGAPEVQEVFVRVEGENGPTGALTWYFDAEKSHPDWTEAWPVTEAIPYGDQKVRVIVDELLRGSTLEQFVCACAQQWDTEQSIWVQGDCPGDKWVALDAAACPENAGTTALEAGKFLDTDNNGQWDDTVMMPGLITVTCGSFTWSNGAACDMVNDTGCPYGTFDDGFYNPSGNQDVPTDYNQEANWEGLGPAVVGMPSYVAMPTDTACTVSVASSITDKDGNSIPNPSPAPTWKTAPLGVLTSKPADGASNIATTSKIEITMNSLVDEDTVVDGVVEVADSAGAAVTGTVALGADGQKITFTPAAALKAGETYEVTVKTTIKDTFGKAVPADVTFTFTTKAS